ncbi:nuclear transport factor 2 family protein [Aestuariibacter salexigens]|uniref:nuclear transport factor 2 family protein n=1 Tax=Aestuariibacter salexigens TaxID=226010 RepID=UPI000409E490|nr:nuclear transport factor 2 family protein [Aestuariibacter salexigens]
MKNLVINLIIMMLFPVSHIATAGGQEDIRMVLEDYFYGSSHSDQARLTNAFHADAPLFLDHPDKPYWKVSASDYISWHKQENRGSFNGRESRVLAIDIAGDIATAKAEITVPSKGQRYIDMFLLKKLDAGWKIISKSAISQQPSWQQKRILFIVSNAHFHGETNLPTGVSFSEIVNAYDVFIAHGYRVDFVSPDGGALPLAYINTSEPMHKKYLYDADFMYAIGNTLRPEQISPEHYAAVHYVGGTNAMYGVADNTELQRISMTIYEKYNGIISSVCHGTAGIVHLRLSNGEYLVKDKRISGYPDEYENPQKPYFKEFPFLITETIESRGGRFLYSPRNTPHVEIDDRVITGQNYLSSAGVALAIIEQLQIGTN